MVTLTGLKFSWATNLKSYKEVVQTLEKGQIWKTLGPDSGKIRNPYLYVIDPTVVKVFDMPGLGEWTEIANGMHLDNPQSHVSVDPRITLVMQQFNVTQPTTRSIFESNPSNTTFIEEHYEPFELVGNWLTGVTSSQKLSWSSLFENFRDFCAESFEDIASEEGEITTEGTEPDNLLRIATKIRAANNIYEIQSALIDFDSGSDLLLDYLDRWMEPYTAALKSQNLKFSWAVDPVQEAELKKALLKIYDSISYNAPMKLQEVLYSHYELVLKELKEVFLKYGPILQQKGVITDPMALIEEAQRELYEWEDKTPPHFIVGLEMLMDESGFLQ